jgi:hypothetical protein
MTSESPTLACANGKEHEAMPAVTLPLEMQPRAIAALSKSPFHELRNLQVVQHEDALLISGTVSSFYHKQLAQEVVRSVCRGIALNNAIQVVTDD